MLIPENASQYKKNEIFQSHISMIEQALCSYSDYFKTALNEAPGGIDFSDSKTSTPSQPVPPVPALSQDQAKLLDYIHVTEEYSVFNKLLNTDISAFSPAQLIDFSKMLHQCSVSFYGFVHRLYEATNPAYDDLEEDPFYG